MKPWLFILNIHCIVSSGVFLSDDVDSFRQKTLDPDALKKNFEREVARMMSKKFEELLPIFSQILQQENTGFNVWVGDIIKSEDHDTRKFLGRYLMRHPFSLERIIIKKNGVEVTSTKESVTTWKGTPLELLARLSQHIPNHYEHLERFYGRHSPVVRGALDAKKQKTTNSNNSNNSNTDGTNPHESTNSPSKASCDLGPQKYTV